MQTYKLQQPNRHAAKARSVPSLGGEEWFKDILKKMVWVII